MWFMIIHLIYPANLSFLKRTDPQTIIFIFNLHINTNQQGDHITIPNKFYIPSVRLNRFISFIESHSHKSGTHSFRHTAGTNSISHTPRRSFGLNHQPPSSYHHNSEPHLFLLNDANTIKHLFDTGDTHLKPNQPVTSPAISSSSRKWEMENICV